MLKWIYKAVSTIGLLENNIVVFDKSESFRHFHNLLSAESDRGTVILTVSILDIALEELLVAYLLPPFKKNDKLFNGAYSPLGSFSAKVEMCYRLGLILTCDIKQLQLLNSIRNDFAHRITEAKLDTESNRNKMQEILNKTPEIADALFETLGDAFKENGVSNSGNDLISLLGVKKSFDLMFSILCMEITQVSKNTKRVVTA